MNPPGRATGSPVAALGRTGAYTAELALVAPVLFAFLLGIIEAGNTLHNFVATSHAAQAGTRLLSVGATSADALDAILEQMGDPPLDKVEVVTEYRFRQGMGLTDWAPLPEDESRNLAPFGAQVRITITREHALLFGTLFSRLAGRTGEPAIDLVVSRTTNRE